MYVMCMYTMCMFRGLEKGVISSATRVTVTCLSPVAASNQAWFLDNIHS